MTMRLLVDLMGAQTKGSRVRGIGRYTRELALALATGRDERIDLRFVVSENLPDAAGELRALLSPHVAPAAFSAYGTPPTPGMTSLQSDPARRIGEAIVRRHIAGIRPDALLASSLYEVAPEDFTYFDLRRLPVPLTSCILYDLIPHRLPKQYLRYAEYRKFHEEQTGAVTSADLLFAISEHTRRDAIELLHIDPDRIVTIGGAADAGFVPRARTADETTGILRRLGLRDRFILCAAGSDPRKNASGGLEAFLTMSAEDRQGVQFVLLVPLSDDERSKAQTRVARAGLAPDDVKFLSRVDDDDLAFLYAQAEIFLFPSLYEGFGLPVLEAMQCGAAIIVGDNSSIPEIADRRDVLCDMSSPAAIAQALAKALRDPAWRADVRAWGLSRAKAFSWASTARRLQDGLLDRVPQLARARPRREPPACFGLYESAETEIADILRDAKAPSPTPAAVAPLLLRSAPTLYEGRARRLLIDVTAIASSDRRTGIQRVVRNIVRSLYLMEEADVLPVAVRLAHGRLRTCQALVSDLLGCARTVPDADLDVAAGDCLLMLDNSWDTFADFVPVFDALHAVKGTVVTCVYDLIPQLHRAASVDPVPTVYAAWLREALVRSDGIITISQAVMGDLLAFVDAGRPPHRDGLSVGWFQCGADIAADGRGTAEIVRPAVSRSFEGGRPVFLIVGTVEPRKGPLGGARCLRPVVGGRIGRASRHRRLTRLACRRASRPHAQPCRLGHQAVLVRRCQRGGACLRLCALRGASQSVLRRRVRPAACGSGAGQQACDLQRYSGLPRSRAGGRALRPRQRSRRSGGGGPWLSRRFTFRRPLACPSHDVGRGRAPHRGCRDAWPLVAPAGARR